MYFVLCIVLVTFILNCSDDNEDDPEPKTGTISGQVTDEETGSAILGANIKAQPAMSSVNADASGNFTISNVNPGSYFVTATKNNYNTNNVKVTVIANQTTPCDILLSSGTVNNSPNKPTNIYPAHGSVVSPTLITLNWACTDTDGAPLTFDVYFDTTNPPTTLIASNYENTSIIRNTLDETTIYYWKIVAKDNRNAKTIGDIWNFETSTIPDDLQACYPFNGNTNDESGNEHHGTIHGAILASDRFGNENSCYNFDGIDDYIAYPVLWAIPPAAVTISVWFNPTFTEGHQYLVYHGANGETAIGLTSNQIWMKGKLTNGTWYFVLSTLTLQANNWYHALGIWEKGQLIQLYVNGELNVSSPVNDLYLYDPGTNFLPSIGVHSRFHHNPPYQFGGKIDDVRIYDSALSEMEIKALYQEGGWDE
jgi:hypothetical protein